MAGKKERITYIELYGEQIKIQKKKIKRMYLRVSPKEGSVQISAPAAMADKEIEAFVCSQWDWVIRQRKALEEQKRKKQMMGIQEIEDLSLEEQKAIKKQYRETLLEVLPQVIEKCEGITGLHAREWKLRDMKSRWGSCNPAKKRIWLNLQLAAYPRECLEYVVLHELTHFLEPGHNPRFWGYMDTFCPQWRTIRRELNGR